MRSPVNRLLAALPVDEFSRLAPELEAVELRRRDTICSIGAELRHVSFPESGAVAMVTSAGEGGMLETGLVANEGLVGLEPFFGVSSAKRQGLVLLPGVAQRMTVEAFARACAPGTTLHEIVRRYACARLVIVGQSALCDATHSIRHRCIRRLLSLHDAAGGDHFPLTQQVLAALLGVRRASVSVAAENLQEAGLILYEHGRMHVADRAGLERAACSCYRRIREQTQDLFPIPAASSSV